MYLSIYIFCEAVNHYEINNVNSNICSTKQVLTKYNVRVSELHVQKVYKYIMSK